jgi:histidyl-tRNA synthetase
MAYKGNMKKRMAAAGKSGAAIALILGDEELARNEVKVKDLASGGQAGLPLDDRFAEALNGQLAQLGRGPTAGRTLPAPEASSAS